MTAIQTCPMCQGIGEVYYVNRPGGPYVVPFRDYFLTEEELERNDAYKKKHGTVGGCLVIDRCHGCMGRGLVSEVSLQEPFHRGPISEFA